MYAVVKIGGHQYRVSEGDVLFVDKQNEEPGKKLTFDQVLLINDGDGGVTVGKPTVDGASVEAELLDNVKADKVIVFKKKRRKGYQVKNGHRQPMSQIEIGSISASGTTAKKSKKKKKAEAETSSSPKKETKQKEEKAEAKKADQVSTDMTAKEAIEHIKNTPLEELKGFVPKDEDRVTVQRAWDSKQEDE